MGEKAEGKNRKNDNMKSSFSTTDNFFGKKFLYGY